MAPAVRRRVCRRCERCQAARRFSGAASEGGPYATSCWHPHLLSVASTVRTPAAVASNAPCGRRRCQHGLGQDGAVTSRACSVSARIAGGGRHPIDGGGHWHASLPTRPWEIAGCGGGDQRAVSVRAVGASHLSVVGAASVPGLRVQGRSGPGLTQDLQVARHKQLPLPPPARRRVRLHPCGSTAACLIPGTVRGARRRHHGAKEGPCYPHHTAYHARSC